eukprot:jgi/Chlat1/3972/Chrsp26S04222
MAATAAGRRAGLLAGQLNPPPGCEELLERAELLLGGEEAAGPTGAVFAQATSSSGRFEGAPGSSKWKNWAGNASCTPRYYHEPQSKEEVIDILKRAAEAGEKVVVVGDGHSNNDIACTSDHMLSLDRCDRVITVDDKALTVTVQGGVRLKQLNEFLPLHGMAMANLGSISEQSIAGAISTAVHGTGMRYGTLSTRVLELELITATGQVLSCSRQQNERVFMAALCGLGALGVISSLKIQCEKAFKLRSVEIPSTLTDTLEHLDKYTSDAEHFRFWYFPHTERTVVWRAERTTEPNTPEDTSKLGWFKNTVIGYHLLELLYYLAGYAPSAVPIINRFYRKLLFNEEKVKIGRSDLVFNFDCLFRQHVNEWAIPQENCGKALMGLKKLIEENQFKVHYPVEVRFVAADDVWLSPCYGRETCYIGVIMYRPFGADVPSAEYVKKYFDKYEALMLSLDGRPHWAKPHSLRKPDFQKSYPKFDDFLEVRSELDPHHLFSNKYLQRVLDD